MLSPNSFLLCTDKNAAAQSKKSSNEHTKTSQSANGHDLIQNQDRNGIDDSDDDSEGDDSDDSDDDEAVEEHNGAANNTEWPSSPPIPTNGELVTRRPEATSSSTTGPQWPSSTPLSSGSSDTMLSSPLSARRGKLPSVTQTRKHLARRPPEHSSLPSKRPDVRVSPMGAPSSTANGRRQSRDEFDPEPIEQDILELSAKYDDSVTHKHRESAGRSVAKVTSAGDTDRRRLKDHRTNEGLSHSVSSDTGNISSTSIGSSSRKRAAPTPLLPERPSRRSFTSASKSMDILPDRSVNAVALELDDARHHDRVRTAVGKTFLRIHDTDSLGDRTVHFGCRAGHPCRYHEGVPPMSRNPRVEVYHNTLSEGRKASLEEAEYILSQANCVWARRFTLFWDDWCRRKGGIEHEERSQVEWLLGSFPEWLQEAAWDCCPIMID